MKQYNESYVFLKVGKRKRDSRFDEILRMDTKFVGGHDLIVEVKGQKLNLFLFLIIWI